MSIQKQNIQGDDSTIDEFGRLPVFLDRDSAEWKILADQGTDVSLVGSINGEKVVKVPRWSARKAHQCGKYIATIIATLFPNDLIFLIQLDWTKVSTASSQVYEILYERCYDQMMRVICVTLDIYEESEIEKLVNTIAAEDVLELFCVIVEQQVGQSHVEAILKKAQRLLAEKFRLGKESYDLQSILEQVFGAYSTTTPPKNSSSSPITPKSNKQEEVTNQ